MTWVAVVLHGNALPSLDEWNAELRRAGFDLLIYPALPILSRDGRQRVTVKTLGRVVGLSYIAAPASANFDWFPIGLLQHQGARTVAHFEWWESAKLTQAASYAAAAALAKLSPGWVYAAPGTRTQQPAAAYQSAFDLYAGVDPDTTELAADVRPDFRTDAERNYDDTLDHEGGDGESADRLAKAAMRHMLDCQRRGVPSGWEKPLPGPASPDGAPGTTS